MPSYKNDPPDQEYLDSIKKHTDKETNKVNLALVAKDFGYASGKSFQKKYAKLKKAHHLTNGHIYGDDKTEISSTKAAPTELVQTPPKETTKPPKRIFDAVGAAIDAYIATQRALNKSKESEEDKKKKKKSSS